MRARDVQADGGPGTGAGFDVQVAIDVTGAFAHDLQAHVAVAGGGQGGAIEPDAIIADR